MRLFTSIRRYKLKLVGKDPTSHRLPWGRLRWGADPWSN